MLDAIQLLNVAKNVAGKHLTIRQQQLDVYTRTSSLTKGLKQQYENFVVTAQAASALARRFDEQTSTSWSDERPTRHVNEDAIINTSQKDAGQSQAHDVKLPDSQTTLSSEEARRLQRQAEFQIPAKQAVPETSSASDHLITSKAQDTYYRPSLSPKVGLSSLPRVKIPQEGSVAQESDQHVTSGPINSDVFHTPKNGSEEPSEDALQAVFRSPKVAGLLLSKKKRNPYLNDREESVVKHEPVQKRTVDNAVDSSKIEKKEQEGVASTIETLPKDVQVRICNLSKTKATEANYHQDIVTEAPIPTETSYQMSESRVPSTRLGRIWQYGGLATSMAFGAFGEGFRRATGSGEANGSIMFSAGNMERLVAKLSKMRGAALKLGQMMSFQG